jgi:hypothetical protein
MAEASSSDSSHTFSLSKEELVTIKYLMKWMYDNNIVLEEQLTAMKQEKDQLLQRLHEMENQLHEAKETFTNYMHEHKVCSVSLSSKSSKDECFGGFESHTRGIGSKLLFKMGYEGKGLGKMHKALLSLLSLKKDLSIVVLDMNGKMEQIPKSRREREKFEA